MRKNHIIFTIDYETWQPSSDEYPINWQKDLIDNTYLLMECAESAGAKLTIMAEMGEYFWLKENLPEIALKVEKQLQDALIRGHDVQLHLHPNWMPETGVMYKDGIFTWNWDFVACNDYPFALTELIKKCKDELERICQKVKSDYRVITFRAGGYRVQPFDRLSEALVKNGIYTDTSVYLGGKNNERGYNFSKCTSFSYPYECSKKDPQYKCKDSGFIELPIATYTKNVRFFIDNNEANIFGKRFLNLSSSFFEYDENFFVFIGHSKGIHNYQAIKENLNLLKNIPGNVFSTISECYEKINKSIPKKSTNSLQEVKEIMNSIYNSIEPSDAIPCSFPSLVLITQKALCEGYSNVLANVLKIYGYKVRRATLFAKKMPNGRGVKKIDTHELVILKLNKKTYLLDATVNLIIPYKLRDVLRNPDLSNVQRDIDSKYKERNYDNYSTAVFYEKVVKYIYVYIRKEYLEGTGLKQYFIIKLKNLFLSWFPSKIIHYNGWCKVV